MKTKYKHIHFVEKTFKGGVSAWVCLNNKSGEALGGASYYPRWRKYVMEFSEEAVFDESCLRDIADFLDVPVSTVRGMLYRGTQQLRKQLAVHLRS